MAHNSHLGSTADLVIVDKVWYLLHAPSGALAQIPADIFLLDHGVDVGQPLGCCDMTRNGQLDMKFSGHLQMNHFLIYL